MFQARHSCGTPQQIGKRQQPWLRHPHDDAVSSVPTDLCEGSSERRHQEMLMTEGPRCDLMMAARTVPQGHIIFLRCERSQPTAPAV